MLILVISCNNSAHNTSVSSAENISTLKSEAIRLYDKNEHALAIKYFDTLITMDSLNGEYYFRRGYSEAQLSKYAESSNDYLKAAALGYHKASAYFNLGLNYSLVDDEIAIRYLKKCLIEEPGHPKAKEMLEALMSQREQSGPSAVDSQEARDTVYRSL